MIQLLSRRDREQLRHRSEILAAAEKVFASKGFHHTTIEDIAQSSEFAIGSIYKHFKNKETIFRELFQQKLSLYNDRLDELVQAEGPFGERFDAYLHHFVTFMDQNRSFFQIFHTIRESEAWHKEEIRQCFKPSIDRYHQTVTTLMERGIREGALRALDPDVLASFAIGTLHVIAIRNTERKEGSSLITQVSLMRELLMHGVAAQSTSSPAEEVPKTP